LLDIIALLVNKPLEPSNISGPALFRVIEAYRPTMLLDEADRYVAKNDDLINIINAGHKKNGAVMRCVGDNLEPHMFSVWCPMVIAGILSLTGTVEERSIIAGMQRKPPGVKLNRFRGDRPSEDFALLASQAARWAQDHQIALANADPSMPDEISNRAADNWRPLLAVADAIGGDWPARARTVARAMEQGEVDDDEIGIRLLADIKAVLIGEEMHTADLLTKLIEKEGAAWGEINYGRQLSAAKLGAMLRHFEIRSEQIKIDGLNRHGYRRAAFERAFNAYLPAQAARPPSQEATDATGLTKQEETAFQDATSAPAGSVSESEFPEQEQSGSAGSTSKRGNGHDGQEDGASDRCDYCSLPGTPEAPLNQHVWRGGTVHLHAGECGLGWHAHQGPRP
jgi:hypothetical protein